MIIKINAPVGIYEIGARAKQEDALFPSLGELPQEQQVVVVCDGIGGHDYGEIASSVVSRAVGAWVRDYVSDDSPMTYEKALEAVAFAQEQLNAASREHPSDKPMGTTLAMLVLGRSLGDFKAVVRARRDFHRWKKDFKAERERIQKEAAVAEPKGITPIFLLWNYYARGRKRYCEL